jgi:7,8-dihydropterin-6-yl-methyl-4-(beta-D-ribofuranosyl)aminobenzene 5'-phosphate synthase
LRNESAAAHDIRASRPQPASGDAVDPIALAPVDEVLVTTLVDNVYDALLAGDDMITRAPLAAGAAQAPQFESASTQIEMIAERGYSAMITVRRGISSTSVLFDTGLSPDAGALTWGGPGAVGQEAADVGGGCWRAGPLTSTG